MGPVGDMAEQFSIGKNISYPVFFAIATEEANWNI
jgi:hypothetical protein